MRYAYVLLCLMGIAPVSAMAAHIRTCTEEAERGDFSYFQAQRICAGAQTTAPAICGNLATRYFTTEQSVFLCTYAQSNAPVNCALDAERGALNPTQVMYVCNQAQSNAPADCALAAMRMRIFTSDQAAQLCFNAVDLSPVYCASTEYNRTRSSYTTVNNCRAYQPVSPPGGTGTPFNPGPLPLPGPGPGPIPGGGGTGQFTSCTLKTAAGSYQGIGFTEGQATAAARDQCLQVESVLACDAGHASCH
jgi:hypothetical protein